jgi:hypothetical protein
MDIEESSFVSMNIPGFGTKSGLITQEPGKSGIHDMMYVQMELLKFKTERAIKL